MKKLLSIFFLMIISIPVLHAQKATKDNFNKIGETAVDFKSGSDKVTITGDTYKALQIKTDAPVHIESLSVVYQDGTSQKIPVRYDFKAGVPSRDINLQNSKSNIKEIDIVYKKVANTTADKATVEVWGSK